MPSTLTLLILVVGGIYFLNQGEAFFASMFFIALLLVLITQAKPSHGGHGHGHGHDSHAMQSPYGPIIIGGNGGGHGDGNMHLKIEPNYDEHTGIETLGKGIARFFKVMAGFAGGFITKKGGGGSDHGGGHH